MPKELCPLLLATKETISKCRKEKCAWWYSERRESGGPKIEMCSIKKIARG